MSEMQNALCPAGMLRHRQLEGICVGREVAGETLQVSCTLPFPSLGTQVVFQQQAGILFHVSYCWKLSLVAF